MKDVNAPVLIIVKRSSNAASTPPPPDETKMNHGSSSWDWREIASLAFCVNLLPTIFEFGHFSAGCIGWNGFSVGRLCWAVCGASFGAGGSNFGRDATNFSDSSIDCLATARCSRTFLRDPIPIPTSTESFEAVKITQSTPRVSISTSARLARQTSTLLS